MKREVCRDGVSRILAVSGDGSIRLISPVTGLALVVALPYLEEESVSQVLYDDISEVFIVMTSIGRFVTYTTATSPCRMIDSWKPKSREFATCVEKLVSPYLSRPYILAGNDIGQIVVYDTMRKRISVLYQAHIAALTCIQAHCSKNILISGSLDHSIKLWLIESRVASPSGKRGAVEDIDQIIKIAPLANLDLHENIPRMMCFGGDLLLLATDTTKLSVFSIAEDKITGNHH